MAVISQLSLDQGANFSALITITDGAGLPFNITGQTFAGAMKRSYTASTAIPFICIVTNAPGGQMAINLIPAVTIQLIPGRYVYDVQMTDVAGNVIRVIEGQIDVRPSVTSGTSTNIVGVAQHGHGTPISNSIPPISGVIYIDDDVSTLWAAVNGAWIMLV